MGDWIVPQHRFRTAALVGEWRETRQLACEDALRARQARPDEREPDQVVWTVPGEIESDRPQH
jgi:hypothetical protein